MRNQNVLSLKRSLPCMSWSPKNLYNLWKRTVGPKSNEITFKLTTEATIFQQRWKSKAAVRAYHGDYIPEKSFKRWYLPDTIPDVRPRRKVLSGDQAELEEFARRNVRETERKLEEEIEEKGLAPVGSLMFTEVERRLDVFVFRCCFAHSVYEARRLVIHGYVKLNGKKHNKANTRLAPGDIVSVDPSAIRFFKNLPGEYDSVNGENNLKVLETEKVGESEDVAKKADSSEESQETKEEDAAPAAKKDAITTSKKKNPQLTPFFLPQYASPWLYIPAYIEVSFATCSAVYVRHPTARPGYSEIPTPYDADGALIRYAWEWYVKRRPRMRSAGKMKKSPEDRVVTLMNKLHKDRRYLWRGWGITKPGETENQARWLLKKQAKSLPPHMQEEASTTAEAAAPST